MHSRDKGVRSWSMYGILKSCELNNRSFKSSVSFVLHNLMWTKSSCTNLYLLTAYSLNLKGSVLFFHLMLHIIDVIDILTWNGIVTSWYHCGMLQACPKISRNFIFRHFQPRHFKWNISSPPQGSLTTMYHHQCFLNFMILHFTRAT